MEDTATYEEVGTQEPSQEQPPKYKVSEFAAKIKAKYPEYKDIDDKELTDKIIAKYPEYKYQIDFTETSKKKESTQLPSASLGSSSSLPAKDVSKLPSIVSTLKAPEIPKYAQTNQPSSTEAVQPKITATYDDFRDHNAERKAKHGELVKEAITNTANKILKNKGVIKPEEEGKELNLSKYMQLANEKKKLQEAYDNGDATFAISKDGEVGLNKTIGWHEALTKGINKATQGNDEANDFANHMTPEQKVDYLDKHPDEIRTDGYLGERPSNWGSVAGMVGENTPYLVKAGTGAVIGAGLTAISPVTGGASLLGLPIVGSLMLTSEDAINHGAKDEITRRYTQFRHEEPNGDKVEQMKRAEQGYWAGAATGFATNAILSSTALKTPIGFEGKNVISKAIEKTVKAGVHIGAVTGAMEGAKVAEGNLEGVKATPKDIALAAANAFKENATTGMALTGLIITAHGVANIPNVVKTAFKYSLKDVPASDISATIKMNVDAGKIAPEVGEKVKEDIEQFKKAIAKTPNGVSPEVEASVAGLIQSKDKLISEAKTKDDSAKPYYDEKIDGINQQIQKTINTGKPYAHEVDEMSGNKYTSNQANEPVPASEGQSKGQQTETGLPTSTEPNSTGTAENGTSLLEPSQPKDESGIVTLPPESFPEPTVIGEEQTNIPNETTKAAEISNTETKANTSNESTPKVIEPTTEAEGGGTEPPKVTEVPTGENGGDWTAIRKEKQREIDAVKNAYDNQKVKGWSETMKIGLEKVQKLHPDKNLYDAATTTMHNIKAGLGHGDLTTDEALATMQYLKREIGAKRSKLADAVNSDNDLVRKSALMQDEGLGNDYVNTALAIKDITTTAGRTLNYAQSELRLDPEHGLQIRRMQLLKAKGGEKLTPEEMKWTEEKWKQEQEIMKQEEEVRSKAMQENFDNQISELHKEYEEKLKQAGKSTTTQKTAKERSLSQKGKSIADKIRQLKKPKGSTNIDFTLGTWDLAVEGIAKLVEAGSTIADAIEKLVKDGVIAFKEQKDRSAFEDHIVESIPEQKGKSEILNDIKEFAKENNTEEITNEMVGKGLIRDYVNSHIGDVEQGDILDVAAKDLKEVLPNASKEKLIEAYLKENEFKQPTKKDLEGGLVEAKKQLNNIAKLTEDIEDLNGLKNIRQRSFPNERAKSQAEQELINEKVAKLKEIKDRNNRTKEDNLKLENERNRQLKKVEELKAKKDKLEKGIIEKTVARQKSLDTPEIEKLKSEVKAIEKAISAAESARKAAERKIESDRNKSIKKSNAIVESETIRQLKKVGELKDKLAELQAGVKKKAVPQEKLVDTPEIERLKEQIKEAERVISDRNKTIKKDNSKIEAEAIRQVKKVQELQDKKEKLENGIRERRTTQPKIDTPEIENLKQQVKDVDKNLREAESLSKKMNSDIQDKKDKIDEMDAGIRRAEQGLDQIKTHRNKTEPQIDAEIEAKKKELKKAISDNATDEQQQAKKLASEKENTKNKIKEFQRKLDEGEFEEPTPIKLKKQDAELIRLKKKQSIIEEAYRKKQHELEESKKSLGSNIANFVRSSYVMLLISKFGTFGKVATMSLLRPLSEGVRKATLGKVFDSFFPGISEVAERGGEGSSNKTIQKLFEAYLSHIGEKKMNSIYDKANNEYELASKEYNDYKNTANPNPSKLIELKNKANDKLVNVQGSFIYKFIGGSAFEDALSAFVNRANEIEKQFGHIEGESINDAEKFDKNSPNWKQNIKAELNIASYVLGFVGRSHSAMKTFSGRASFAAGFMARLEGAVKNGQDIRNPDKVLEIAHESYLDWERGKYQQSNLISDLWNNMINKLGQNETGDKLKAAKVSKYLLQLDVSITRVPVNILHEAVVEYTFGLVKAAYIAAKEIGKMKSVLKSEGIMPHEAEYKAALREKISQMDEKQAATIVRCFSKGGLGAGLYAVALITGAINFGIFPHMGQKKKKEEDQLGKDELNPGQIMIGDNKLGETMSGIIEHIPALYPTFMGIGMAQAYKDEILKGKTTSESAQKSIYTHLKIIQHGIPQLKLFEGMDDDIMKSIKRRATDVGVIQKSDNSILDESSDTYKLLKEKGVKIPTFGTTGLHKIEPDDKHPAGIMSSDEFIEFNKEVKSGMEEGIKSMLKKYYTVTKKDDEGVEVDSQELLGKDLSAEDLKNRVDAIKEQAEMAAFEKLKLKRPKQRNVIVKEQAGQD